MQEDDSRAFCNSTYSNSCLALARALKQGSSGTKGASFFEREIEGALNQLALGSIY
jgi:hypothetical protein